MASKIVSFAHAPEATGVYIHGPGPIYPPLVGASLIVQTMVITEPLQSDREGVSSLCTNPHSHSFFRYRCPLFWLLYPGSRPSLASAAVTLISLRQGAPPILSGRIILEKLHARGPHL